MQLREEAAMVGSRLLVERLLQIKILLMKLLLL